jgi:hypothetical protein
MLTKIECTAPFRGFSNSSFQCTYIFVGLQFIVTPPWSAQAYGGPHCFTVSQVPPWMLGRGLNPEPLLCSRQ